MVPSVPHIQKNVGHKQARAFKPAENPYCTTANELVNKPMELFTATKTTQKKTQKTKKYVNKIQVMVVRKSSG